MTVVVWVLGVLTFGILVWFYYLQFRSARMEARTVNQLWHVLSDEEIQAKINRMDSKHAAPSPTSPKSP